MATSQVWRKTGEQFFDNDGLPLAGGYLEYKYATTALDYPTFKDFALSNAHPTKVYLDASGRLVDPIYTGTADFKELQFTAAGAQVFSEDEYPGAV